VPSSFGMSSQYKILVLAAKGLKNILKQKKRCN
jgi:hypothetical protein